MSLLCKIFKKQYRVMVLLCLTNGVIVLALYDIISRHVRERTYIVIVELATIIAYDMMIILLSNSTFTKTTIYERHIAYMTRRFCRPK